MRRSLSDTDLYGGIACSARLADDTRCFCGLQEHHGRCRYNEAMLLALLALAAAADWVPARWPSAEPQSLELLSGTPVNCLLLEEKHWAPALADAAAKKQIATLGIIRPNAPDPLEAARLAMQRKLTGIVLEGDFPDAVVQRVRQGLADSSAPILEIVPRVKLRFDAQPVAATYQGVWAGIQVQDNGHAKAAPSGAPWIDTNTGFLRFLRAASTSPVWIANAPPAKTVVSTERYLQVIGDAAIVGARWVVALDDDLSQRLLARESRAMQAWQKMGRVLQFYEASTAWRAYKPAGQFALVQDVESGALLSGGILDMVAIKHTPVRPVPNRKLTPESLAGAQMAVDVDPAALTPAQQAALKSFTQRGGTLLKGPPGWKFSTAQDGRITLSEEDVKVLDDIWKDVNLMTGRKNLGARLFNVASMLSNLVVSPDGKQAVLHLLNYADYPVDSVTVHLLGKYRKATLLTPDKPPQVLSLYDIEEGHGVDVDQVGSVAALVLD